MKSFLIRITALLALLIAGGCDRPREIPTGELFVMTTPPGAVVEINGEVAGPTPLQTSEVPVGDVLLTVRKQGFRSEYLSLRMSEGGRVVRELTLQPLEGLVLIRSTPPGAAVTVDDELRGNTPLPLHNLDLGPHRAQLALPGYNNREVAFDVEGRTPTSIEVDMISNSGSLVVHSEPSGATLFVDGRNRGATPASIERLQEGQRDVTLEMAGYQPYRGAVEILPGETARLDASLDPLPARLRVVTRPAGARVYLNEEPKGDAPVNLEGLAPGAYSLRVEMRGHADISRTVSLDLGEKAVEEFELQRNSGTLQIITRPAGVRVNIDGEYMGTTQAGQDRGGAISAPLEINLISKGPHTLQLVREGYSFQNKRFFIRENEVTTLDESLERKFIPNVLVRTGSGKNDTIEASLVRRHPNGDLELEIRKGVFRTMSPSEYVSVEPLKRAPEEERPPPAPETTPSPAEETGEEPSDQPEVDAWGFEQP